MALKILDNCIACDMCLPECPNDAISMVGNTYVINPDLCTECMGHYDNPTCLSVCPINNCIVKDPDHVETKEQLFDKYVALYDLAND